MALYEGGTLLGGRTLNHDIEEIRGKELTDQLPMRMRQINEFLSGVALLDAVVGRGGLLHPLPSGPYVVNKDMLSDLAACRYGVHASNLGAPMASLVSETYRTKIPAMVVDPVVVDEMDDVARLSGLPEIERRSVFHALNQKAVARVISAESGIPYNEANLVVAHLGGGVTVGAHRRGRVVDVNNGLDGDGPMSPERAGCLPAVQLVHLCFAGGSTYEKMRRRIVGEGGFVAHLGTNDLRIVERQAASDEKAALMLDAFAYQVAKEIGRAVAVLSGDVDAIIVTGGAAFCDRVYEEIYMRVHRYAKVYRRAGEDEMLALAEGALRVLEGKEHLREYKRWDS